MSLEPWADLIAVEQILQIHDQNIQQFGGNSTPIPAQGCLERSLGAAWSAELYIARENAIPGLNFAGCLLYYLIQNHCFIDGNKRVAWASCLDVLRVRGLTVEATDDEAEQFCEDIIGGTIEQAVDVSLWLAPRLVSLPN